MNSRGGQKQRNITDKKQSRQSAHKNKFNHFKSTLQKSEILHRPSQTISTPTNPSSNPSSHPPWGAHLGRANAPAEALGPGRSENQAWQDETILHGWHGAENVVISSYQKSANPSRSRRKNLSRNDKSNDTTNENRLCRRLADTRDLKSLSGDRVRVRPPSAAL